MRRWATFFFFLLQTLCLQASEIEVFFKLLKNQDFIEAKKVAANVKEPNLRESLLDLTQLLSSKSSNINTISIVSKDDSKYLNFVKHLLLGYQYTYNSKQNNLEAFKRFSLAIKISNELDNKVLEKSALIALLDLFRAEIFIGSKQFEPYLERFAALATDQTDEVLAVIYNLVFLSKADDELVILDSLYYNYIGKLDSVFQDFSKSHPLYSTYYYEKGIYHKFQKNLEQSKEFFNKSDSLASRYDWQKDLRGNIAWQLSSIHMENNQPSKAKNYLLIARKLSRKLRDTFYNDRLASAIFQEEGNYDSAYHYLRKSVNIEYQLGYKNNTLESSILTVQNQTDKLKLDKLELETQNQKNRNLVFALGLVLVFGASIGFLVHSNTKRKQLVAEQQNTLQEQKVANLLKEQELVTIDAIIEGQEKERQRIANELHDDLGGSMATIKLYFNSLQEKTTKNKGELFSKTNTLLDEAYKKIRQIAHAKNSGVIAKQGLLNAVEQMAEKISAANRVAIIVKDFGLDNRLENSLELTLFRIIQELTTNVIKHAKATYVNIHLTNHGDNLNILIEDNGIGFDTHKISLNEKGMGLKSIDKRVNHLDGTLHIESELGKGATIIINIPV